MEISPRKPQYSRKNEIGFNQRNSQRYTNFSYAEIAEYSAGLTGGDIKNITLKLCIKICAGRITALDTVDVKNEIDTYKQSLEDSKGIRIVLDNELAEEQKNALEDKRKNQ